MVDHNAATSPVFSILHSVKALVTVSISSFLLNFLVMLLVKDQIYFFVILVPSPLPRS